MCLVLLRQTITLIAILCICFLQVLLELTQASASLPLRQPLEGTTATPVTSAELQLIRKPRKPR